MTLTPFWDMKTLRAFRRLQQPFPQKNVLLEARDGSQSFSREGKENMIYNEHKNIFTLLKIAKKIKMKDAYPLVKRKQDEVF